MVELNELLSKDPGLLLRQVRFLFFPPGLLLWIPPSFYLLVKMIGQKSNQLPCWTFHGVGRLNRKTKALNFLIPPSSLFNLPTPAGASRVHCHPPATPIRHHPTGLESFGDPRRLPCSKRSRGGREGGDCVGSRGQRAEGATSPGLREKAVYIKTQKTPRKVN